MVPTFLLLKFSICMESVNDLCQDAYVFLPVTFTSKLVLHQDALGSALLAYRGSGLSCIVSFPVNSKLQLQMAAYCLSIATREKEQR